MLSLWNPQTAAFVATDGYSGISNQMLLFNVILDLRVTQDMLLQIALGNVTETPTQMRLNVVNTVTPPNP